MIVKLLAVDGNREHPESNGSIPTDSHPSVKYFLYLDESVEKIGRNSRCAWRWIMNEGKAL